MTNSSIYNLAVEENLTLDNVSVVLTKLKSILSSYKNIVLDVSRVKCIDSSGIALIVELKSLCNKYKNTLNIVGASSDLISLCGLYKITI